MLCLSRAKPVGVSEYQLDIQNVMASPCRSAAAHIEVSCHAAGREKVRLKSGSKEVLQKALRAGVATHICSVNWSQEMVRGTLNAAATAEGSLAEVEIHCNNLAEEGARSTGRIARQATLSNSASLSTLRMQGKMDGELRGRLM